MVDATSQSAAQPEPGQQLAHRRIKRAIGRLGWRLRLQAMVRYGGLAAVAASFAVVIGIALYQGWLLPPNILRPVVLGAIGLVGLGVLVGLLRRFDRIRLAQRLDSANNLKDRLGTALTLMARPASEHNEFERAQIRDAMQFADTVQHAPAAPWHFPREIVWVVGLVAIAWGLTYARLGPPDEQAHSVRPVYFAGPGSGPSLLPPEALPPPADLADPVEQEVRQFVEERVEENEVDFAAVAPEDDEEAVEFVSELNKVLKDLALGDKDDRVLTQKAADLEAKLDELAGTPEEQQTAEELAEAVEEVAKTLEKQAAKIRPQTETGKSVKEAAEELAKALAERRYDDAVKALDTIGEKYVDLSKKEQKALAEMFEKLADKHESKLSKKLHEKQAERSRLERKQKDEKLSRREERRLKKLKKELKSLERAFNKQPEKKKQLDRLTREMRELADKMTRTREAQQAENKEVKRDVKDLEKALKKRDYDKAMKKMEELAKKWNDLSQKQREQLAKMFEKLAKKYQSQMMRDMKKLKQQRDRLQRKQDQGGGLSKNEKRRLDRTKKQLEKLQSKMDQAGGKSGNKGKKQLDDLNREMKKLADKMRRQRPKNQQQGKSQQDRKKGAQRKSRMNKDDMKRLKEMMKRMGKQQRRSRLKKMGQMRLADLKELMRRRKKMNSQSKKRLERLARGKKKGGKKGGGKPGGEPGGLTKGAKKDGHLWKKGNRPREVLMKQGGALGGEGAGRTRDQMLQGKATDIDAKMKEDFLAGQKGKGPSDREILYGAAKAGTKVQGYGKVHIDYSMRASRQMADEEVPPGYREYVEEYFRLIRER